MRMARSLWAAARSVESSYNARLRQVARHIGHIVTGIAPTGEVSATQLQAISAALVSYSHALQPWAAAVSKWMVADVSRRNERAWREAGTDIGRHLLAEIKQAPTGMLYSALMDSQVELITSLPLGAAKRVHDLVETGMIESTRAADISKMILATGEVTASRARLIARTEVARASSSLTQARSMYVGSEGYVWRTSEDEDVRVTHKKMEGKYVPWNQPPKTDPGLDPYHAGCGPNCRCYPDPVLPR